MSDSKAQKAPMRWWDGRAAVVLAMVLCGAWSAAARQPVRAEPWASVNDIQLKNDLTTLKEYGIIPGTVTTWPIPWAAISGALARAQGRSLPPHVMAAIARVRAKMPKRSDFRRPTANAEAMATNRARFVRDFGGGARGDFDSRVSFERHWASAYARLSVNFRDDPVDPHDVNLDGSYGAVALGNWMLFAGRVEQWWGPGWDTALLLSNNARPMPMVGLARLEAKPFRTKWLRWIGPWNVRLFGGRMSKLRADFAHPWLVGYRIDFSPAPWLSLGLTRLVQFCGKGRPCGAKTLFKVLNPAPNQLNVKSGKLDRGNAQAGYDIAFHGTFGSIAWSIYAEQAFEDQAEDNIATYGVSLTGRMEAFGGGQWRILGEASDTLDDRLAFNLGHTDQPFSTIYRNGVYTDGSIYRRRTLGSSLDFDSLLVTGRLMMQFDAGPSVELILRHAGINPRANNVLRTHLVSRTAEKINMLETRVIWPTKRFGTFRLEVGIADDVPNTPDRSPIKGRVEVGWRVRF